MLLPVRNARVLQNAVLLNNFRFGFTGFYMSEKGNQEIILHKNLTPNYLCFLHLLGNKCLQ